MPVITFTKTVSANSVEEVTDDRIKFGPLAIYAIYVQSANANEWTLKIGQVDVSNGKGVTTAWDNDMNKLIPINVGANYGEYVRFVVDNSANSSADTVTITVFYEPLA